MQQVFVSQPSHNAGETQCKCKIVKKVWDLHPRGLRLVDVQAERTFLQQPAV